MAVVLVGANPGVLLLDGERPTAFASVWRVDWSAYGSGPVLVLVHAGRMRVLTPDVALGRWIATAFVRHFGEAGQLPWEEPSYEEVDLTLGLDLARGVTVRAADVVVEISGVLDRQAVDYPVDLGGAPHRMTAVYAPCSDARITVAGERVPGAARVQDGPPPSSSGFLAVAEVWTD